MKPAIFLASLLSATILATPVLAAEPLKVEVDRISQDNPIPEQFALCEATPDGKSTAGKNERPSISWSHAPKETKSFAIIMSDPDVPADFSKAGKDGQVVGKDEPRQLFYHWGVVNIPATATRLEGGEEKVKYGMPLANDLGKYMPDAKQYGGPCPPWNDERLHHYHFTVYALDVAKLDLPANATAKQADAAIKAGKHVLSQGEIVGTYTLNKAMRK